jgi:hypothetical protein
MPIDLEQLRAKAAQMGEGVEFVSAEPVRTDSGSGYQAVYRFRDVNLLQVSSNPAENLSGPNLEAEEGETATPIRFRFTRGATAALEVQLPEPEPLSKQSGEPAPAAEDEATLHMLRQIYQDMKIRQTVQVEGQIVETNAAYRDGSTVTITDLDFGRLLQDDQAFRSLVTAQPKTLEDLRLLVGGNPALRMELQETLRVRFR